MPRKRPTESSWDSDDELLNEDTFSFTTSKSKDTEEELDEDALLGLDDESEIKPKIKQEKITPVKVKQENAAYNYKDSKNEYEAVSKKKYIKRSISPIAVKQEKPDDFEFSVETDDIELFAPDETIDFDSSQNPETIKEEFKEEPDEDEPVVEEVDEGETTYEKSHLEADVKDESDESEDEDNDDDDDGRRNRFKSERNITTSTSVKTSKSSATTTDIPDNLEISDEQQAQINEFMSQKNKKWKPFQKNSSYQPRSQPLFNQIQTITSSSGQYIPPSSTTEYYSQPSVPQSVASQPPTLFSVPLPQRPKVHLNPKFFPENRPQVPPPAQQPLLFGSPPRNHYDSPPRNHHMPQRPPPPLMDHYRPPYSQPGHHHPPPPPHLLHQYGHPPTSQHFQGLPRYQPPFEHRFYPAEHRPPFSGPPPHMVQSHGPPHHHQPRGPPHQQSQGPQNHQQQSHFRPRNPFEHHGQPPRPFGPDGDHIRQVQPRPNPFHQDQRPPQGPPRMEYQPRNAFPNPLLQRPQNPGQPRPPLGRGQRGGTNQPAGPRFQGQRPSLQQQHTNKILQKAREARLRRFSNEVQNIPVIGRQAVKRPATEGDGPSPPKAVKQAASTTVVKVEDDDYQKKMEQQKALREQIQRQKELKRQIEASKRRKDLQERLAKEGKDIADLDTDSVSSETNSNTSSVGRGQHTGQRGQPNNRGQRGMPVDRGQQGIQRGMIRGRGQMQRGMPNNRGQGQNNRGAPSNRGQGPQNQGNRGQGFHHGNRGRGVGRGGMSDGEVLKPGQTMRLNPDGTIDVLCSPREVFNNPPGQRQVLPLKVEDAQINNVKTENTNRSIRRMKKIIRIKKNLKGEEISREIIMEPIDDDDPVTTPIKEEPKTPTSSPLPLFKQEPITSPIKEENKRFVVVNDQKENTRTVISGQDNEQPTRKVISLKPNFSPRSSTVQIDNLSSSTSMASIRQMGSTVGRVKDIQKNGKSVIVSFFHPKQATKFLKKYNRHMIDLSHISVELI